MRNRQIEIKDPPPLMEANNLQRQILGKDEVHKKDADWIVEIKK